MATLTAAQNSLADKNILTNKLKASQVKTEVNPDWCPGCGDFGITNVVQQAIAELGIPPWETMLFSGIGCSGKTSQYVQTYGVHTLHGRVLPFAIGAKLANPKLTVIAAGGDGDGYGIGAGHFLHAGRRNVDLTYIVFNNEVYGLTKGQASPTLELGSQPKSLPLPHISSAINPLVAAMAAGYTFVARSYSFDAKHLKKTLMEAIQHKGMALVDVLQPCPTYNDIHTKDFFGETVEVSGNPMPRIYYLEETGYDGVVKDPHNADEVNDKRTAAIMRAYQKEDRVPVGVYFKVDMTTYDAHLQQNLPPLRQYAPVDLPYHDANMVANSDLTEAYGDLVL